MSTSTGYTCNQCKNPIEPEGTVVHLGCYCLYFHPSCFTTMSAAEILRAMGEDETSVHHLGVDGHQVGSTIRARDPRRIQPDGSVTGETEYWPGVKLR